MSVPFSNTKLRVPKGFETLLEGFAREVLRAQPKCIIQFGSLHFSNLLRLRTETGHDPVEGVAELEDRFYNNDSFKQRGGADVTDSAARREVEGSKDVQAEEIVDGAEGEDEGEESTEARVEAACKIQAGFKGYKVRKEMKEHKMKSNAATKIQAGIRGHLTRKKLKKDGHGQPNNPQPLHYQHEQMYRHQRHIHHIHNMPNRSSHHHPADENNRKSHGSEIHKAATKIQAQFRGFRARQEMKVMKVKAKAEQAPLSAVDPEDPRVHDAATKIQAMIRGRKARKEIKVLRLQNKHNHGRHHGHGQGHHGHGHGSAHHTRSSRSHNRDDETRHDVEVAETTKAADDKPKAEAEEVIDIDLNDPEVALAASKIQKGFRGHLSKRQTSKLTTVESTEPPVEIPAEPLAEPPAEPSAEKPADETDANNSSIKEDNAIDIDLSDPEVSAAATKIQANFRGHQTRQKLKDAPEQPPVELPAENQAEPPVELPVELPTENQAEPPVELPVELPTEKPAELLVELPVELPAEPPVEPPVETSAEPLAEPPAEPSAEKPAVETDVNNSSIKEDNAIDIDLTDPEVSAAATKIQANFRGHQARQKLKDAPEVIPSVADVHSEPEQKEEAETKPEEIESKQEEIDIDLTDPEVEAAAQKIQASFRGHMKLKRKQTISAPETQEEEAVTVAKDKEQDITEVSGVQEEKEKKEEEVTEGKEKKEEEDKKEEEEKEEVTDMKPTNQSGSVEGDQVNKTEDDKSAAASAKQEVPAEMKATAATPKATDAEGPVTPKADVPETPKAPDTEEVDIDLGDPDVAAATKKLQAGFRGRLNRRKKAKEDAEALAASTEEESSPNQTPTPTPQTPTPVEVESTAAKSNEIDDIDLNDPELAAAALKIQSSFRGHITRKSVKKTEEENDVDPASEEAMSQKSNSATPVQDAAGDQGQKDDKPINYEDPQVHLAATKIQAGFKGYQTRKSLKKQAGSSEDLEKDGGS